MIPLIKIKYEGTSGRMQGLKKERIPEINATIPVKSDEESKPGEVMGAIIVLFL